MDKILDRLLLSSFMRTRLSRELGKPSNSIPGKLIANFMERRSGFLEKCAVKILEIQPNDNVLEVGHGTGQGLRYAHSMIAEGHGRIFGIDYSQAMVNRAQKLCAMEIAHDKIHVFLANVGHLPFPDNFFHKVFHSNCFYYWPSLDRANREMFRVMKPGSLMVTTLCLEELRKLQKAGGLKGAFVTDPVEYMLSLEEVGFKNVRVKYFPYQDNLVYQGIFAEKPFLSDFDDAQLEEDLKKLQEDVIQTVREQLVRQLQKPLDGKIFDKKVVSDSAKPTNNDDVDGKK